MWSDEVNPDVLGPFITFTPPGPGFICWFFHNGMWGGEHPSKEKSDSNTVSRFTPPDLSKTLNANPPLFVFIRNMPGVDPVTQS